MVFGIGPNELLVVLIVAVLLFGPKKLPELAKSLGRAMAEFNKAKAEIELESIKAMREEEMRKKKPQEDASKKAEDVSPPAKDTEGVELKESPTKTAKKEKTKAG